MYLIVFSIVISAYLLCRFGRLSGMDWFCYCLLSLLDTLFSFVLLSGNVSGYFTIKSNYVDEGIRPENTRKNITDLNETTIDFLPHPTSISGYQTTTTEVYKRTRKQSTEAA